MFRYILARVALLIAAMLAWELVGRLGVFGPLVLPPLSEVLLRVVQLARNGELLQAATATLVRVFGAFVAGGLAGVVVGAVLWRFRWLGTALEPYIVSMKAVPAIVFYPILLAVLGLGSLPIMAIAGLMAFVPLALNTMVGLREVPVVLPRLAASLNCTPVQTYVKVLAPAATPLIISGLRLAFIYAILGTIASEFMMATGGLGFSIGFEYRSFEIADMYAYIVVVAALGVIANAALTRIAKRVRADLEI